ncbi:integral membrane protein MviN [Desulfocapsa sulfexigens DSM 10523]|uniref:Probable lipid II flippase MurJ n=1 Tax=Desulfocapsa sulfexigens (strain DSM 10523 / SB164P1) TaxID=1167006 RepID=M1PJB8_DESSD|nr:murein biosynthesis integral membrane protein MurJ [Desulfocapsa sulfexigens]AGF79665.1 integral membrane protein MviN [Desulfocapsa sulfexigens DSM 10523]
MKKEAKQSGKIARSAGTVSIAVMCSRVLGLVREQIFAGMFGAGFAYDAFVVAFRIPNLLRDLFAEGALSAAFITVFTDYDTNRSKQETWQLASNVLVFFAILLSAITLLGIYFSEPLVNLLASDFSTVTGKQELTILLTRIMLPFLVFISLAAVVMGILNSRGKFFIPAMASAFFNLGSIVGGVSLAFILPKFGQPAIVGMAIGTLLGGLLQLSIQFPALLKCGFRFTPRLPFKDPGLKRIITLMIPAVIGLSPTQINIFINTNFASSCVEGSVSWLNYAFRLVQLPIGIFGVALSIAAMPVLARHAAKKDIGGMKETMVSSLTMVFGLTIPASIGLMMLAQPIIHIIFERGAFTAFDTIATANTLTLYAVGLFAYSSNKILVPVFYALEDTKYPLIASFIAVGANLLIINLTIDSYQHLAIALSTSCSMILNFFFLSVVLYLKTGGYSVGYLIKALGKIIVAGTVMAGFLHWSRSLFTTQLNGSFLQASFVLLILIIVAASLYGLLLHLMKLRELTSVTSKIYEKFGR